jgi:DNA-binding PadR family transcriptional regulator
MKKLSGVIGNALLNAYILYSCNGKWESGYAIMNSGKKALLTTWSAGSFYPIMKSLMSHGMLTKRKAGGQRVKYEYRTTAEGRKYLALVAGYMQNPITRTFMRALLADDF